MFGNESSPLISVMGTKVLGNEGGNPAVYGYKIIVFLLLYIYALNSASDQCT